MVARTAGGGEAAGSSPVIPTIDYRKEYGRINYMNKDKTGEAPSNSEHLLPIEIRDFVVKFIEEYLQDPDRERTVGGLYDDVASAVSEKFGGFVLLYAKYDAIIGYIDAKRKADRVTPLAIVDRVVTLG